MCSPPILTDRYMIQDCSNGYSYGSNCSLSCMGGFPLIGNDTITCEKTENGSIKTTYWDVGSYNQYCKSKLYSDCSTGDKCSHYIIHKLTFTIFFSSANPCDPLLPPANGAITCARWLNGQICTMQCQGSLDIPYGTKNSDGTDFDGKFVCSLSTGKYLPSDIVPNCTG